jgi:hypothetical protein
MLFNDRGILAAAAAPSTTAAAAVAEAARWKHTHLLHLYRSSGL